MTKSRRTVRKVFDEDYYRQFYKDKKTAVLDRGYVSRLSSFVVQYLQFLEIPVHSVLDLGCGLGWWKEALEGQGLKVNYTGVEISDYLCEKYGWEKGSVATYQSRRKYDLVICQGVLPYLRDTEARAAVLNLARFCRGALYLEAVTLEDQKSGTFERSKSDREMLFREASWYRKALGRHFENCGGGVFVPRYSGAMLYELEKI